MKTYKKPTNWRVTEKMLQFKQPSNPEFKKLKWVEFCEHFFNYEHLEIFLTEAKTTNSKYLTLEYKNNGYISLFTVRFSDHKPNIKREKQKDCDFFVGVTNLGVTNTKDAIIATQQWYIKSQNAINKN